MKPTSIVINSQKKHNPMIQFIILMVISLTLINPVPPSQTNLRSEYALMIDAGSTGTRLHIFEISVKNKQPKVKEIKANRNEITTRNGPLHQLAEKMDKDEVENYLNVLFSTAQKVLIKTRGLTKDALKKVPVYLRATAGVRALVDEDKNRLLRLVSSVMEQSGFQSRGAAVLSGQEEAVYAWLSTNDALGRLEQGADQTLGIIEMGGGSLQVAFSPKTNDWDNEELKRFFTEIKVGDKSYPIYAFSYENLGQKQAIKTICESDTTNACQVNCALSKNSLGDYHLCQKYFSEQLNKDHKCSPHCGLNGMYQGIHQGDWIGLSNINHLSREMDVELINVESLEKAGRDFCQKPYKELKELYPKLKDRFQEFYCVTTAYLSSILFGDHEAFDGIGLDAHSGLKNLNQTNTEESSWARGFIFLEKLNRNHPTSLWQGIEE
ncbi:MAG: hypothetical protein KA436_08485 [Oligoflexales bacterium]|nr:hypothetical protein [Oligoflexales bacterium]